MNQYLIDRLQNFTLNRKIISVESDDRDIVKYPNANEFEITCPQLYTNVESIRLLNIQIPNKLYNISEYLENNKLKIQIFAPYAGMFETIIVLNDGLYTPQQLADSMNFLINQFINANIPIITPPPNNYFIIEYNEVNNKFYFISEVFKFKFIFSGLEYSNCYNKVNSITAKPVNNLDHIFAHNSENTWLRNEYYNFDYANLPYNDPFRPHGEKIDDNYDDFGYPKSEGSNENPFESLFYTKLSEVLSKSEYQDYINEQQSLINSTLFKEVLNDKDENTTAQSIFNDLGGNNIPISENQLKLLQPSIAIIESIEPVDLDENKYIYMEIEKYNTCDELIPYLTQKYTNVNNGITNSYFAKIPIIRSEYNQSLSGKFNYTESLSYYQPPIEKIGKLKFKFRYHNGQLVDFHNYNISFDLEINQIRNEIKDYDVRRPFTMP